MSFVQSHLLLVELVHYLLPAESEAEVGIVDVKNSVLYLVPPEEIVSLEVLDAFVRGHELVDTGVANVPEVRLAVGPFLGGSHFKEAHVEGCVCEA